MKTRTLSTLAILTCLGVVSSASAQPSDARFEVGGQLSALRITDFGSMPAGFGARLSYDVVEWAAVESELNFFPSDTITADFTGTGPNLHLRYRRRRAEAFFGPKVGLRGERFGIFAKVRPGFARLTDKGVECAGEICALVLVARPVYRTELALDLGTVLEFYPSSRIVTRLDLGDTMIRHRSQAPPCRSCTTHNFASRVGIGFRF